MFCLTKIASMKACLILMLVFNFYIVILGDEEILCTDKSCKVKLKLLLMKKWKVYFTDFRM